MTNMYITKILINHSFPFSFPSPFHFPLATNRIHYSTGKWYRNVHVCKFMNCDGECWEWCVLCDLLRRRGMHGKLWLSFAPDLWWLTTALRLLHDCFTSVFFSTKFIELPQFLFLQATDSNPPLFFSRHPLHRLLSIYLNAICRCCYSCHGFESTIFNKRSTSLSLSASLSRETIKTS